MEIPIKLNSQDYQRLRRHIPAGSTARQAIDKATPIAHALGGVEFEGYAMTCNEEQTEMILGIAKQCCPEIVVEIENGVTLARSQAAAVKFSRS